MLTEMVTSYHKVMLNVQKYYSGSLSLYMQYFKVIRKVTIEKGNIRVKIIIDQNICITSTFLPLMKRSFPQEIHDLHDSHFTSFFTNRLVQLLLLEYFF